MNLKKIAVKGIGPFENSSIFTIPKGVSVIYGLNKSCGKNSKNSNWCGKSLFFSSIAEVLYDEPVVGSRQDKIKKGTQCVIVENHGKSLKIVQKDNKLFLYVDKKPQDILTKTKAQEIIKEFWPLTKEEYETFVHIDSRIPHPLVMGSTAERKKFFSSFFGLDKVDAERKLYMTELRKLSNVKEAYRELKNTYNILKKDFVSPKVIKEMNIEKEKLSSEFSLLRKETVEAQEKQRLLDFIESICDNKKLLEDKYHIDTMDALITKIEYYHNILKKLKDDELKVSIVSTYKKHLEDYNNKVVSLPDFCKKVSIEKAKEGYSRYTKLVSEYDILKNKLNSCNKELASLHVVKPAYRPVEELKTLLEKKELLYHQLTHAKKFKTGICPTCGQSVEIKDPKSIEKSLKEVLENIDIYNEWRSFSEKKTLSNNLKEKINTYSEQLEEYSNRIDKYKKYADAYKLLRTLPEKPQPPDFDISIDAKAVLEKKNKVQKALAFLDVMKPYMNKIEAYNNLKDKTYPDVDMDKVNKLSDRIAVLKTKIAMCEQNLTKIRGIKERLLELREKLKYEKPLEYLVDIYSDKQLKKRIIQIIGTRLMSLVNKYAAVVFNEDYHFELVWDTQIHILCTRKAGKNTLVSDVRKLSGAESKLFTIILVLSLLSFVPSERRSNVLILDEPTANFSSETTKCFQDLLALLSQIIESIIIITPRSEDIYPGAKCFTVLRNGVSQIVEGHPDTL